MYKGPAKQSLASIGSYLVPLLLFVLAWEAFSRSGLVKPILVPPPTKVFARILLLRVEILRHVGRSLYRLLLGYLAGAGVGVSLGVAMGFNRFVHGYFHPIISILMPVPGITWTPIFVLVLGFGDPTLVAITFLASFFPAVYNTAAGVRSVKRDLIWAAKTMGVGRLSLFYRVLLPSSAAYIITGLKLGLARGWRTLIAVEMIAAALWGLGFFIFDAKEYLRTADIYAGIVVMAVLYALIESLAFGALERRTIDRWGMTMEAD